MKANKLIGIRLINYFEDGINFKDHASKVLDFWIQFKCRDFGFHPLILSKFKYVEELPNDAKEAYKGWFESYDFQNEDKDWVKWLDGKLNFFYKTNSPKEMPEDTWYVYLVKAEEKAREICEEQIFHGNPNIDSFWKLDTNTKSAEVAGRRNGYVFSIELSKTTPLETKGFYWAVAFQAPESVKLYYQDGDKESSKIISWAANCKHMTLMQITSKGRFIVKQVFVKGKGNKEDRNVPQENIPEKAYLGHALVQYFDKYYYNMYGIWDEIDEEIKAVKESTNQRRNAVNTMNDEEVDVGKIIRDINDFIEHGNVSKDKREFNKKVRKNIREKNKFREREIRKKIREAKKSLRKKERRERNKMNPFIR